MLKLIFYLIVKLRYLLYKFKFLKKTSVPTKVVSIGNITVGGAGKTPFLIFLTNHLKDKLKISIVEKGYKGSLNKIDIVEKESNPAVFGDEPVMLKQSLPDIDIVVSKNKTEGAKYVSKSLNIDLILVDDGFQHLRLHRDLDILLINTSTNILTEKLLPTGKLREPLSAISRADIIVLTKTNFKTKDELENLKDDLSRYTSNKFKEFFEASAILKYKIKPKKKDVFVLSAIEDYKFMQDLIKENGFNIIKNAFYPDHYSFTKKDIEEALSFNIPVLTTSKDFVKIIKSKFWAELSVLQKEQFVEIWYEHDLKDYSRLISYILA